MMDIGDIKKVIDNVAQKPFLCSDTEIETQNGYIITTKAHYDELAAAKRKETSCRVSQREDGLWEHPVCGATDQHGQKKAIECLESTNWIPASERLPDVSGTYQVTCMDGRIHRSTYAKFQSKLKRWELTGARSYWKVIAWMLLPKPYKENDDK